MADETRTKERVLVQSIADAPIVKDRREYFTYRDLGLKEASCGRLGAKTMHTTKAMTRPTGWHYHVCEAQFNILVKGWADLVFEDGTEKRVQAGDVLYIPGGMLHNEIRTADEVESIEVCVPADMGTVAVDPPAWWVEREKAQAATVD